MKLFQLLVVTENTSLATVSSKAWLGLHLIPANQHRQNSRTHTQAIKAS